MGKKEKAGKKKGPLKKLSKCFFFWGNKRKSIKEDEELKQAHSESSVANNSCSVDTNPDSSKQNIGEYSGTHKHSNFQLYCDVVDTPESEKSENPENVIPESELQNENAEGETSICGSNEPKNESREPKKLLLETHLDDNCNTEITKPESPRFVVTPVTDIKSNGSRVTSERKDEEKSNFSSVNRSNDTTEKTQINFISNTYCKDVITNLSKREVCHSYSSSPNYASNNDVDHHSKLEINQPNTNSVNCTDDFVDQDYRPKDNKPSFSLDKQADMEASKLEINQSDIGLANSTNKFGVHYYKFSSTDSDVNKQLCQTEIHQSESISKPFINDTNEHKLPKLESILSNYNSANSIDVIGVHDSKFVKSEICLVDAEAVDCTNENDIQPTESQNEEQLHMGSDNIVVNSEVDVQVTNNEECDSEKVEAVTVSISETQIEKSIGTHPILDVSDHSLEFAQLNRVKGTVTDKVSPVISEDHLEDELMEIPKTEEMNVDNDLNSKFQLSLPNTDEQEFDEDKDSEAPPLTHKEDDHPSNITKCNGENFMNESQAEKIDNYPSVSLMNGTSDTGVMLDALPYTNQPRENENLKVLSVLTTREDNELTEINWESETLFNEENVLVSKDKAVTPEGTVRHNIVSAIPTKCSRLPVRKSSGSEVTVEWMSKLSPEIEPTINHNKQKPMYNNSRSNSEVLVQKSASSEVSVERISKLSTETISNKQRSIYTNRSTSELPVRKSTGSEVIVERISKLSTETEPISNKQRSIYNTRSTSELPVRKSTGSEVIVEQISKLSTETEPISNNSKQKPIHNNNNSKSSLANRSRSKIPRKCDSTS